MKRGLAILAMTMTLHLTSARTLADAGPPPATVRADVQMVTISSADAAQLVPALQSPKTAAAAWTRLQEMIGKGEATLLGWPVTWVENGARNTAANVWEKRYPTEFAPPEEPTVFGEGPPHSPSWDRSTPTAFATRDIGFTLEMQAAVEPGGQIVDLRFVSQCIHDAGTRKWHSQKSPAGFVSIYQQPNFHAERVTTEMRVHCDRPTLAGVFILPASRVELHILHARVILPPASTPFSPVP